MYTLHRELCIYTAQVLESEPLFKGECSADYKNLRRVVKIGLAPMFMGLKTGKPTKRLHSSMKKEDALHEKLLTRALTEQPFIYSLDSTLATRSYARKSEETDPWRGADERFLWNRRIVAPLERRAGAGQCYFRINRRFCL